MKTPNSHEALLLAQNLAQTAIWRLEDTCKMHRHLTASEAMRRREDFDPALELQKNIVVSRLLLDEAEEWLREILNTDTP